MDCVSVKPSSPVYTGFPSSFHFPYQNECAGDVKNPTIKKTITDIRINLDTFDFMITPPRNAVGYTTLMINYFYM
jgi:hypothetical protein